MTAALLVVACAFAAISGPAQSYIVFSDDRQRVLVMVSPAPAGPRGRGDAGGVFVIGDAHYLPVRRLFTVSGVYDARTGVLLHAIPFARRDSVLTTPDLRGVVRWNRFAVNDRTPRWAIEIWREGTLLATHPAEAVTSCPRRWMPFTTGDWHLVWYRRLRIDGDRLVVRASAPEFRLPFVRKTIAGPGDVAVIDLTSGAVVTHDRRAQPWIRAIVAAAAVGALAVAVAALLAWRSWRIRRPG